MSDLACTPCEFCDKMGLPVLPVRYAIAPEEAKAPKVAAPFAVTDQDGKSIPLGGKVQYTTRLLRSGYLYVYDEARNRWSGYYVTEDAYFMRFSVERPMPAAYVGRVPCSISGHPESASMVTISDPKNATKVWFGFSDVEWTPATMKRHASADYRKQHMQMLDVQKVLAGAQQEHAQKIAQLGSIVSEYSIDPVHASRVFFDAPFPYRPRKLQLKRLIEQADALRKGKGVVLALNDPAGIAKELVTLMQIRMAEFMSRPEIQRPLHISAVIEGLEASIKSAAKAREAAATEEYADMIEEGPAAYNSTAFLMGAPGDPEAAQEWRDRLTPEFLKKVAEDEWHKYTHHVNRDKQPMRFDDGERRKWQKQFDESLMAFDRENIAPLAQSHVAWMRSGCMGNYFSCSFDDADPKSGLAYAATLKMCIDQTADKKFCFDLYEDWLNGSVTDKRNLVLRALCLNQENLAKKVEESTYGGLDWRVLPSDTAFSVFAELLKDLKGPSAAVLGGLLDQLGGVLVKITRNVVGGKRPGLHAVALMGGVSGRQIARLTIKGSKKKFIAHYVRELARMGGPKVGENQLRKAVAAQVRLLGYEGMRLVGDDQRSWLVALDRSVLKGVPPNASGAEWAKAAAKAIHSPETLQKVDAQAWRSFMGSDLPGGLVGGILQVAMLGKLISDYTNAMAHEAKEAVRRMWAGVAALAGTLGETSAAALNKMAQGGLINLRGGLARATLFLKIGGRSFGTVAAFVTGVLDWEKGQEAKKNKNYGLAKLYYASTFFGAAIAVVFFFKFISLWIIFALVAFLMLVTYLIEIKKDNTLQEWLDRCYFSISEESKYSDFEIEQRELELALRG